MKVLLVGAEKASVAGGSGKCARCWNPEAWGRVYTQGIPDTKAKTLLGIMQDRLVCTDTDRSYNVLDVAECKPYRINHSKRFVKKHKHINGIENCWNQAERPLRTFTGVPRQHFHFFLKKCEGRFNTQHPQSQLSQLRQ